MCPIAPGLPRGLAPSTARSGALLQLPVSDNRTRYEAMAYLQADDGASGDVHAFLAYKETDLASGAWRVRVKSLQTAGGVFEPAAMVQQAQAAARRGQAYFVWGYHLTPTASDPRRIEFRVHVLNRRPARLELYARLRRADHSPGLPCSVVCDWP
ncbi:hypothetical protein [Pseudorhodoferax sp. Leaf267]|uniref:hypothetical protein n=1 Tax=Pseudorhodoferax sp. Leaf267 TaxID=1736316 RepID=UPI000701111F|nr:hypothetical protein [Pseudorhodoferax sp. Leaf267]KQP21678.1 hypothetical protein ASF43_25545 [Pseudorhodoferax sp. Leaf267]